MRRDILHCAGDKDKCGLFNGVVSKHSSRAFCAVGKLRIINTTPQSVLLMSPGATLEIGNLADDLFRLRIVQGMKFSTRPSWAVSKTDWPSCPAKITQNAGKISLQTASATWAVHLSDGAWDLSDFRGQIIFAAKAGATGFIGEQARVNLSLAEGESIFGLGETTGTFNKRGLIREFWNQDVLGHAPAIHPSLRNLYLSIPFAISLRSGQASGLFWDNPARQTWDLGQTLLDQWQMSAASGEIDLYLFTGQAVATVVSRYTSLTGRIPMLPRWALGYHQSRYGYKTRAQVEKIAQTFRRRKIPCDALYLDIHHMDGYRVFTFGKTFPKPAQFLARLRRQGFKVVTIVDPGVKNDLKFGVLKRGRAIDAFVKEPTGTKDYIGKVWPGPSRFPDFLNARVRQWWGREQSRLSKLGVSGFWNDMNEPANFALPSKTLPEDCRHDTDAGLMWHRTAHNLYGMEMARASYEGSLAANPGIRPFIITRAGYAGVQRHAVVWTGDNSSVWEHLADTVQMLLNLGLSGLPFCGADVGGFLDNATPELLVRWMQMAALTPFFRNHSNIGTISQEPWAFGSKAEDICRRFIDLRQQLLPCLYGLLAEAHLHGHPIIRPLFWHFQNDPTAAATGDQFLLGSDLLIAPILRQGATARSVYLPHGDWFDFWTGRHHRGSQHVVAHAPLETIPIYARAGGILPLCAVRQFTGEKPVETINLHVWPGASGRLEWYEDDGVSMGYLAGRFLQRSITAKFDRRGGTLNFTANGGGYNSDVKKWRVILRESPRRFRVRTNGRVIPSRFDPSTKTCAFEFTNSDSAINVSLR